MLCEDAREIVDYVAKALKQTSKGGGYLALRACSGPRL